MNNTPLPYDFLKKVTSALQDEEIDVYTMMLYLMDSDDMNFFGEPDRDRVKKIFKVLSDDTKQHIDLLKFILEASGG